MERSLPKQNERDGMKRNGTELAERSERNSPGQDTERNRTELNETERKGTTERGRMKRNGRGTGRDGTESNATGKDGTRKRNGAYWSDVNQK